MREGRVQTAGQVWQKAFHVAFRGIGEFSLRNIAIFDYQEEKQRKKKTQQNNKSTTRVLMCGHPSKQLQPTGLDFNEKHKNVANCHIRLQRK